MKRSCDIAKNEPEATPTNYNDNVIKQFLVPNRREKQKKSEMKSHNRANYEDQTRIQVRECWL